ATSLIFCGVAGGLDPELPVGAVLLADAMAIHDYGVMAGGRLTATASGLVPLGAPELEALTPVAAGVAATLQRLAEVLRTQIDAPNSALCVPDLLDLLGNSSKVPPP